MSKQFPLRLTYEEALQREYEQMYKFQHPESCIQNDPYDCEDEFMYEYFERKKGKNLNAE